MCSPEYMYLKNFWHGFYVLCSILVEFYPSIELSSFIHVKIDPLFLAHGVKWFPGPAAKADSVCCCHTGPAAAGALHEQVQHRGGRGAAGPAARAADHPRAPEKGASPLPSSRSSSPWSAFAFVWCGGELDVCDQPGALSPWHSAFPQ